MMPAANRQARAWVLISGSAPRPILPEPFDPARLNRPEGQTEALLRNARLEIVKRAMRSAGGGGRQSGPDSDLQAVWEVMALMNGGAGPACWNKAAEKLGMTPQQVREVYKASPSEVRAAFRAGEAPIGRRDPWDCWYASKSAVRALFEPKAREARQTTQQQAVEPVAVARVRDRMATLQAKLDQGRV